MVCDSSQPFLKITYKSSLISCTHTWDQELSLNCLCMQTLHRQKVSSSIGLKRRMCNIMFEFLVLVNLIGLTYLYKINRKIKK